MRPILATTSWAAAVLVMAGAADASPGWNGTSGTITDVIATETGVAVIVPNIGSPVSCPASTWFRLQSGLSNYQGVLSTIMTAKAQGRPIKFWVNQCDTDGASIIVAAWMS